MNGGKRYLLDVVEIELRDYQTKDLHSIYVNVYDNSLSRKWLTALNHVLSANLHLEKNYCFLGFSQSQRHGSYILEQINHSISAINQADLGYTINDRFDMESVITDQCTEPGRTVGRNIRHERFNRLHRYFEDLQGVSGSMSSFWQRASSVTRWHIRQLNLLCHEFESWALSYRKELEAPEWQRPSTLMCWLNAPRFDLDSQDLELFGIDTINRDLGGVFVGVNKAVGKHHWEIFNDEGRDSRINELISSTLHSQTEAAADFDIEWGQNPSAFPWQQAKLKEFEHWLRVNGFDPCDPQLTLGHPQIGQIDLERSFGSNHTEHVWPVLNTHLDVWSVSSSEHRQVYDYHWSDRDFATKQMALLERNQT
jgi:hypothetical protein